MRIVNTFISDGGELPAYTRLSLEKARKTNPNVMIDFICKDNQPFFRDFDINWIPQDSLQDGEVLRQFNEVCWFKDHGTPNTTHPSPELFWHRTCERIYYLSEYINRNRLYDVFHFENDVLIYGDISTVQTNMQMSLTPMSDHQATFAFVHIPVPAMLRDLCFFFNVLLERGNDRLIEAYGFDHVSEMSLLYIAHDHEVFSTFPTQPKYIEKDDWLFDPGSYGQYLGGTNNGHSNGFTDPKHFIGRAISSGEIDCGFDGVPYVTTGGFRYPLFNLHIHSKNLEAFANV